MNTYEKKRVGVGHRQPFGELSKDTKGFRITSLSRNAKQLPWNDIVAENPRGAGGLEVQLEVCDVGDPSPAYKQTVLT